MSTPTESPIDPPRIRLGLSPAEWEEFQRCLRRTGTSLQEFFTRKALEVVAQARRDAGRTPN